MDKQYLYQAMDNANIKPIKVEQLDRTDHIKVSQFIRLKLYHKDNQLNGAELLSAMNIDNAQHYQDTMKLVEVITRLVTTHNQAERHTIYEDITSKTKGTHSKGNTNVSHELNSKWLKVIAIKL